MLCLILQLNCFFISSYRKLTCVDCADGPTVDKSVTRMYGYDDIPVNLSCIAYGRPVPEFLWQKVGRRTSTIATVNYLSTQSAEQQVRLIGDSRNYRLIVEYFPIHTVCNLEVTVNSARNEQALFGNYRCSVTSRGADVNDSHSIEFLMGGTFSRLCQCFALLQLVALHFVTFCRPDMNSYPFFPRDSFLESHHSVHVFAA